MIDPKIKELLDKNDFVVIPSKLVRGLWQTEAGYLKFTVIPEEDGTVCRFMNHDSIHLI